MSNRRAELGRAGLCPRGLLKGRWGAVPAPKRHELSPLRKEKSMLLLVTGATGKVGAILVAKILAEPRWRQARVRALCHNRVIPQTERIEVVTGNIVDRDCVDRAVDGVTHVVHLATCKEVPEIVMDVAVK